MDITMNLTIPFTFYKLAFSILLMYLVFSFVLWLPTPVEMSSGISVGAPAGAIVGIFLLPFAGLFYIVIVGLVLFLSLRLYDYLDRLYDDRYVEVFSIKGVSSILILMIFLFFHSSAEDIVIEGKIDSDKSYFIGVKYKAQRGGFFCTEWIMWSGTHRKSKYYKYYPDIQDNNHHIEVPTDKFFFSFCNYKVEKIEMDINYDKVILFKNSDQLGYVIPPSKREITFVKLENNIYTLDIGTVAR